MNGLPGFISKKECWILAMGKVGNDLYLATDIETFDDAWGPVSKVVYRAQPELIVKSNVSLGSIIPLPFNPAIHPPLRPNERLCHWKSNDDWVHAHGDNTPSAGASSTLAPCPRHANYSG